MKGSLLALLAAAAMAGGLAISGEVPAAAGEEAAKGKPAATAEKSAAAEESAPRYTADGKLIRPENYREWVWVSTGLGMSYSEEPNDPNMLHFDNVWVRPESYRHFLATGTWPDKTMFMLEVRHSTSQASINKNGHFQADLVGLEAAVKDEARFPERWAYFGFRRGGQLQDSAAAYPKEACYQCHATNAAVDNTFVQFYPVLRPVAEAKGTYDQKKAGKH